jgi:hypothetical protein
VRNKRITVKKYGKPVAEFYVTAQELKLADRLGLPRSTYILMKAKLAAPPTDEELKYLLDGPEITPHD